MRFLAPSTPFFPLVYSLPVVYVTTLYNSLNEEGVCFANVDCRLVEFPLCRQITAQPLERQQMQESLDESQQFQVQVQVGQNAASSNAFFQLPSLYFFSSVRVCKNQVRRSCFP